MSAIAGRAEAVVVEEIAGVEEIELAVAVVTAAVADDVSTAGTGSVGASSLEGR